MRFQFHVSAESEDNCDVEVKLLLDREEQRWQQTWRDRRWNRISVAEELLRETIWGIALGVLNRELRAVDATFLEHESRRRDGECSDRYRAVFPMRAAITELSHQCDFPHMLEHSTFY